MPSNSNFAEEVILGKIRALKPGESFKIETFDHKEYTVSAPDPVYSLRSKRSSIKKQWKRSIDLKQASLILIEEAVISEQTPVNRREVCSL